MDQSTDQLPHWDMSVVYPGLDSIEFNRDFESSKQAIKAVSSLFDQLDINAHTGLVVDDQVVTAFEKVVASLNQTLETVHTLRAYIYSFVATDSRSNLAQSRMSEFQLAAVKLSQLGTRFTAWLGSIDVDGLLKRSKIAGDYQHMIRRANEESRHLMSPTEEELASELELSSGSAWGQLYDNLSSQIVVEVDQRDQVKKLPMSAVRNLAYEADREIRRIGFEAELASWKQSSLPLAAALNSIKGEVITLCKHRGYAAPLDEALFNNNIDRQTLEALHAAVWASFPDFRRYLKAKARMLGLDKLPWYDLFAPVNTVVSRPNGDHTWTYAEGSAMVIEQFSSYSARMGDFARRAFSENWIDAEPRVGKHDGAFCMPLRKDESRVLANYQPGFKSVLTLAHELGHGYHNLNLSRQLVLNRETPMTLAETSSIFCETIVRNAMLRNASPQEQVQILEGALVNACQIVVDVTSRFIFESHVFDKRSRRELSVDELCDLMVAAQQVTYGDGLDSQTLHPFMWAAKSHYYSSRNSFYNFPYTFGLLFGLGLYGRYLNDPDEFKSSYDNLLASTGLADPATLAKGMGIDIHSIDFWTSSLDTIREDIDRFEKLAVIVQQ